jgi:RNA polymerase sigma factor (sigma-70 family)
MAASDAEFELLFREEFPAVERTVFLICHDHELARDTTQDAFVQLLRHWKKVSRYERPGAWVRRVAIRLTIQSIRRDRLRSKLERELPQVELDGPVDVDLLRAVRTLPPKQRAAVVLFYFDDLPLAEVADVVGCSQATARVHVKQARARLADLLGEEARDDVG